MQICGFGARLAGGERGRGSRESSTPFCLSSWSAGRRRGRGRGDGKEQGGPEIKVLFENLEFFQGLGAKVLGKEGGGEEGREGGEGGWR